MSNVTLESLRADFEAAIDVIADDWSPWSFDRSVMKDPQIYLCDWMLGAETCAPGPDSNERKAEQLARLYLIGRDHGLEAAMLYKLSHGAIDPRVSA